MSRLRVVVDTNVLISAALKPAGAEAQILWLVAHRTIQLCVSEEVLAEYRGVFSRPKFAHIEFARIARLLGLSRAKPLWSCRRSGSLYPPMQTITVFTNAPMLPKPTTSSPGTKSISQSPKTPVVTARQFLDRLASAEKK